jgi:hypothetical protein
MFSRRGVLNYALCVFQFCFGSEDHINDVETATLLEQHDSILAKFRVILPVLHNGI